MVPCVSFGVDVLFNALGIYRGELVGHVATLLLFRGTENCFLKRLYHFIFPLLLHEVKVMKIYLNVFFSEFLITIALTFSSVMHLKLTFCVFCMEGMQFYFLHVALLGVPTRFPEKDYACQGY